MIYSSCKLQTQGHPNSRVTSVHTSGHEAAPVRRPEVASRIRPRRTAPAQTRGLHCSTPIRASRGQAAALGLDDGRREGSRSTRRLDRFRASAFPSWCGGPAEACYFLFQARVHLSNLPLLAAFAGTAVVVLEFSPGTCHSRRGLCEDTAVVPDEEASVRHEATPRAAGSACEKGAGGRQLGCTVT